ncbi:Putative calcium-binding protein [Photobacterium marinum]|uniref:Putative calcium-binding protein n=1 Tax=Photobacterium marinum TaxID=1056511 RepID=L8JAD5_9GAMM|nr:LamG-like jellyroll fold domain-containing protein [Photobacterium marinum]ELR64422.1 Putative calcium-binding protein [Photobacterium marinum]
MTGLKSFVGVAWAIALTSSAFTNASVNNVSSLALETNTFSYDLSGRLIGHNQGDDERRYHYDGEGNLLAVVSDFSSSFVPATLTAPATHQILNFQFPIHFQWQSSGPRVIYELYMGREPEKLYLKKSGMLTTNVDIDLSGIHDVAPIYWKVVSIGPDQSRVQSQLQSFSALDTDADSLPDHLEYGLCTSASSKDSDGDGVEDQDEILVNEVIRTLSSPCSPDSDGDGMEDAFERSHGSDLLAIDDNRGDNWEEYVNWSSAKAKELNVPEKHAPRLLDLSDNNGHALSGIVPNGDDITLMYWVKTERFTDVPQHMGAHDDSNRRFYIGNDANGNVSFGVGNRASVEENPRYQSGRWTHFALTYTDGTARVYVNGELHKVLTGISFDKPSAYTIWFGDRHQKKAWNPEPMDGVVDDIQVWDQSLSIDQIRRFMVNAPSNSDNHLKAWYDFSDSRGDWVKNGVTGRYDLKLIGGAHLSPEPAFSDADNDGLADRFEVSLCTDSNNADTDGDGVTDGVELGVHSSFVSTTNPCDTDTDNDGIDDKFELVHGSDALFSDGHLDADGDGKTTWNNYVNWQSERADKQGIPVETSARVLNITDNDGYAISGVVPDGRDMTLMYWLYSSQAAEQLSGSNDGNNRLYLGVNRNSKLLWGLGYRSNQNNSEGEGQPGEWVHVALSRQQNVLSAYVNGHRVDETSVRSNSALSPYSLWFGALNNKAKADSLTQGVIDDIQVWGKGLSQASVRQYMMVPPHGDEDALIAYYDFMKSRGYWVQNKASGQYDLKLVKGAKLTAQPEDIDSDNDGISDRFERGTCTGVNNPDTDGDGILDGQEYGINSSYQFVTNPCSTDTDNDGISDTFEQQNGMDPLQHDSGRIGADNTSNWHKYVDYVARQQQINGVDTIIQDAELDLVDNQGYAMSGAFPEGGVITIMYWLKYNKLEDDQYSGVIAENGTTKLGYDALYRHQVGQWGTYNSIAQKPSVNNWVHLALVADFEALKLYINGNLVSSKSIQGKNFAESSLYSLWFGALNDKGRARFPMNGSLDDILVWNKPLTQSDIRHYMVAAQDIPREGLLAHYDFSSMRGDWVENKATGVFDMLLVNGAHTTHSATSGDSDRDGLSDDVEKQLCTDMLSSDTDGDGLSDGEELGKVQLFNGEKVATNPCDIDTDNDGMTDDFELHHQMNPVEADSYKTIDETGQTYWQNYLGYVEEQASLNSVSSEKRPRVLDTSNTHGFALTGLYFDGQDMTFMYWYKAGDTVGAWDQAESGARNGFSGSKGKGFSLGLIRAEAKEYWGGGTNSGGRKRLQHQQWVHVAVSVKQQKRKLYVNGHYVGSAGSGWYPNQFYPYPVFIGALNKEGQAVYPMKGLIDDVQVWNRSLTNTEIRRLMMTPSKDESSDLKAYYSFDESRGSWVKNQVTGQYDMWLKGGASLIDEEAFVDSDHDGLDDKFEHDNCLSNRVADSDGDGLLDGQEYGLNSLYSTITNPCDEDTDNDGIPDGAELAMGTNALSVDSGTVEAGTDVTHWQTYAQQEQVKADAAGIAITQNERVLDVRKVDGYAHTGLFPDSKDTTFMYWVNFNSEPYMQKMGVVNENGGSSQLTLGYEFRAPYGRWGRWDVHYGPRAERDRWIHLAFSVESGVRRLYVNGKLIATNSNRSENRNVIGPWAMYLGAVNEQGTAVEPIDGLIDDVQVWNRALSDHEIRKYMFSKPTADIEGLTALYDFTAVRGDWVRNEANQQFDLKLENGAKLAIQPADQDTDGDGLVDRLELSFCTDGLVADSDKDGLDDGEELGLGNPFAMVTNPCDDDTDRDGMTDGYERFNNSDGLLPDGNFDSNANGIVNWFEYAAVASDLDDESVVAPGVLDNRLATGYAVTPIFPHNGTMTFMYWVKSLGEGSQVSGVTDSGHRHYYAGLKQTQEFWGWGANKRKGYSWDEPDYEPGQWTHVALIHGDNRVSLYINGQLSDSFAKKDLGEAFERSIWLGALNQEGEPGSFIDGVIDDVSMWDRALSPSELHRYMVAQPDENAAGLQAYYDFSTYKSNWVLNRATNRFDLKLVGDIKITRQAEPVDSDNDGIEDRFELVMCTDPLSADSDNDGVSDSIELGIHSPYSQTTEPCDRDTDNDGMSDGYEYQAGSNPVVKDANMDTDGDGLKNWYSYTEWKANQRRNNGAVVRHQEQVLDLTENDGVGYTGIYPNGEEMSLIYDVKFTQIKDLNQRLGTDDDHHHRFYLGIDKDGDVSYGVGNKKHYKRFVIEPDVWYSFALSYKASVADVYIDGEKIASLNYVSFSEDSQTPILLGALNNHEYMKAEIDNVQVWSVGLDSESVNKYRTTPPTGTETNLKAFYNFNYSLHDLVRNEVTQEYDLILSSPELLKQSNNHYLEN